MIKEVYIKNFKSISDETVKLDEFSIIVGKNGAGKSNFIQAVSLLRDVVVGDDVWEAAKNYILTPREIFNRSGVLNDCEIGVLVKNGDDNHYEFLLTIGLEEKASGTSKLIVKREVLTLIKSNNERVPVFERNGSDIFDKDGLPVLIAVDSGLTAVSLYKNEYANKVKSLFKSTHLPINEIVSSVQIVDTTPIADKVARLVVSLKKDADKYERFLKFSTELMPWLSSFVDMAVSLEESVISDAADAEYLIVFEEKNLKGRLSMKAISHGDIKTLYYIAAAVLSDKGTVFFFEEIENGMHPERVANLVKFLERISYREDKQFVFTTHSTRIINCTSPENVIFVSKKDYGSRFVNLSEGEDIAKIKEILNSGGELFELLSSKA